MPPCAGLLVSDGRSTHVLLRYGKGALVRRGFVVLVLVGWLMLGGAPAVAAQAPPPPQTLAVEAGGQTILADFTTTAAETFTTVTSVSLWDGEAWSLVYRPGTGNTDFPIKPGSWLWIVSPGAQIITIAAPPPPPGPDAAPAASCAFVDGAARVAAATAQVLTPYGLGTAFYIGDEEWVTAAHVVADGGRIRLRTETREATATVIGRDDAADLALLRASGAVLTALAFADYAALRLGETLGAAGYPNLVTGSPSVSDGLLSKFVTYDGIAYIQTNAEISPGNSGGPLFTSCGHVAGVNVAKVVGPAIEGISFAVTIPTIEDRLPRLRAGEGRGSAPLSTRTAAPLEISAVCSEQRSADGEWQDSEFDECRAAGAAGVRTGRDWWVSMWMRGVENWDNLAYRFDGGAAVAPSERNRAAQQLAPGRHTVEAREQRGSQWTGWSAPYSFTVVRELEILAVCNWQWNEETGESKAPETAADCSAWGRDGIRTGSQWIFDAWIRGQVDYENVVYRLDGGATLPWAQKYDGLDLLASGSHTLEVREQHPWGWTEWSAPYPFTVTIVVSLAICDNDPGSFSECYADGQTGIARGAGITIWANVDYDEAWYSVNGGDGVQEAAMLSIVRTLPLGRHTIRVAEFRSGDWTGWSPPFTFTIEGSTTASAPTITAICNVPWDDVAGAYAPYETAEACHAAGLNGVAFVGERWHWWGRNFSESEDLQLGIDGGAIFDHVDRSWHFRRLGPGQHYVHIRERLPNGEWTAWGEPYLFTVTIVLRVAICDDDPDSFWECYADGQAGIRRWAALTMWGNVLDYDQARYSVNGGDAKTGPAARATVRNLPRGQHTIRMGEFRSWGWTGWSPPFTFTIQ